MKPPCEGVIKNLFPAIRAGLVQDLIEGHGLTQAKVAKMLGITQPAVSQYVNNLRGSDHSKVLKKYGIERDVKKLAADLANKSVNYKNALQMYCELCTKIRKKMPCI